MLSLGEVNTVKEYCEGGRPEYRLSDANLYFYISRLQNCYSDVDAIRYSESIDLFKSCWTNVILVYVGQAKLLDILNMNMKL
jgi:hypothetical protein